MKSIFSDPTWWSRKVVGSARSYALMVSVQIFGAAAICYAGSWRGHVIVLVFFFTLWIPLLFLYALRRLVSDRPSEPNTNI
jgi:hypothetical protein